MNEHDFEPVRGLPGVPPQGEVVLWQGSPNWRVLARHGLRLRGLALYFTALLGWFAIAHAAGFDVAAARRLAQFAGLAGVALALVALFAYLVGRTTVYTVTNRRVAIRFGVALSMTLNLPLAQIEAADMRANRDGSGDVALRLTPDTKIAYLLLWPHARPWRMSPAEPMLRAVQNVAALSAALCRAAQSEPLCRTALPAIPARTQPVLQPAQAA